MNLKHFLHIGEHLSAPILGSEEMYSTTTSEVYSIGFIPIEFILFACLLLAISLFHKHVLPIAVTGLTIIFGYKILFTSMEMLPHLTHEMPTVFNLFGLLVGFEILASYFEKSGLPDLLPDYLPNDWKGGAALVIIVGIMSTFLDNIAAAVIGGTIAYKVFHGKVHLGLIVAIVASSNAGGADSVIGDTTTTMMWIDGVPALEVTDAFLGSIPSILIVAYFGGKMQDKHQPIQANSTLGVSINWNYLIASMLIIIGVIATNILFEFPAAGVWGAILLAMLFVKTDWHHVPAAMKGAIFLLCLVLSASMMPVETLPKPTWLSAVLLGFVSAVFDNIPLTKLALSQGGYDWGLLAYAVGFGGSLLWFGSSAGVAISNIYPSAKSTGRWLATGWFAVLAYLVGVTSILLLAGWSPTFH